jgi:hypothetical protein
MEIDTKLLLYDNIAEFKRIFYKDLVTQEHVTGGQIKIDKISTPDGSEDSEYNFWGWVLEKNGYKYLVPSIKPNGQEIRLKDILPLMIKNPRKVASKGIVYYHVISPVTAKFKSEKNHTFREMIDFFSSFKHTNPKHQKLMWFFGFNSLIDRNNWRISTPPGFGKDSCVDILGNLVGNCATVENPTVAKLEFMTTYKWIAINETIDLTPEMWRNIEQFLLAAGAMKPEITKHSRAVSRGVKETLDISKLSLSLMYNDIDCYPEVEKYFDFISKKAVRDRFPALRFYGKFQEDFNTNRGVDTTKYVEENVERYKKIIYSVMYYKDNYSKLFHNYSVQKLDTHIPERWSTNLLRVTKLIDCYSESQEEFDDYLLEINKCMMDYREMLSYPTAVRTFIDKLKIPKDKKIETMQDVIKYLKIKGDTETLSFLDKVHKCNTFIEKNLLLNNYKKEKEEVIIDDFWGK